MKQLLFFLLLLGHALQAQPLQPAAKRFWRMGDYVKVNNVAGTSPETYDARNVSIMAFKGVVIRVMINNASDYYAPAQFLNEAGQPYGNTAVSAVDAWAQTSPVSSGTGVAGVSSINGKTGAITTVVETTGSYTNPSWLTGIDATKITESTTRRFLSDSKINQYDGYNSQISTAATTANTALTAAGSVTATVATHTTQISSVSTAASSALSSATSATATAGTALSTANSAISTANSATASIGTLSTQVASVTGTANNALTTSNTAISTANSATASIGTLATQVSSATGTANNALNTANTALSAASSATAAVAGKASLTGATFSGPVSAPTATTNTATDQVATTLYLKNEMTRWFRDTLSTYGPGFDAAQFVKVDSAGTTFIRINPGIIGSGGSGTAVVDQTLSASSTRAVSNAAVTNALATTTASLSAVSGLLVPTPVLSATATDPTTVALSWTTSFSPIAITATIFSTTAATVGELQRVLTNAPAGSTIRLSPGMYPFNGTNVTASFATRPNVTIEGSGNATFVLGSTDRLLINGSSNNLTINGISFSCTATTGNTVATGQGLLDINEQGVHTDLSVTNCNFTAPACLRNGISINTYSAIADGGSGAQGGLYRFKLRNCNFNALGRMGIEILNHAWSDSQLYVLVKGIEATNNTFNDLGRVAETGGAVNGMAASFSGRANDIRFISNGITDSKTYGLEIVGSSNVTVSGNTINYTGTNSFVGISLADGYGNGADATRNIAITGNSVRTLSRPLNMRGSSNIDLSGNTLFCDAVDNSNLSSVYLQKCIGVSFTGGSITTGSFNPLRIDDCSEVVVSVPRITSTNTNNYALISVYGGTGYAGAGSTNIKLGTSGTVFRKSTGVTSTTVTETIGAVTALTTF